jgi:hypothetical protein
LRIAGRQAGDIQVSIHAARDHAGGAHPQSGIDGKGIGKHFELFAGGTGG